ncbi:MAG: hypothetical protein V1811_01875 [Candidatus Micrarchaeota archaeon]
MPWKQSKKPKIVAVDPNSPLKLVPELNVHKELTELIDANRVHIKNILAGRVGDVPSEQLKDFGLKLHWILNEAADVVLDKTVDKQEPLFKAAVKLKASIYGTNQETYKSFEDFHESLEVFGHWRKVENALKTFERTKKAVYPVVGKEADRIVYIDPDDNTCRTGPLGKKSAFQNALDTASERRQEHEKKIEAFVKHFFGKVQAQRAKK